jgi:hypothetical protein
LPGVAQAAIAAAIFINCHWKGALLLYFTPLAFYHFLKVKSELASSAHLQEECVGGPLHHHYKRAHHHCPVVDRVLQKNTHIADDHGKKLPKTIVSLK